MINPATMRPIILKDLVCWLILRTKSATEDLRKYFFLRKLVNRFFLTIIINGNIVNFYLLSP